MPKPIKMITDGHKAYLEAVEGALGCDVDKRLMKSGLLDRKRKAGTRVAVHSVHKATLEIPVIRDEITSKGCTYHYSLIGAVHEQPLADTIARMQLNNEAMLFACSLHAHGKQ